MATASARDPTALTALQAAFRARYGAPDPVAVIRAPGRINLIGEHIDYAGLAVLPMALQRHVALLIRPRTDAVVRIANLDPEFPTRAFAIGRDIPPYPAGDWGNYAKAAVQALARTLDPLDGFDGVIGSSIPIAAGLSSSSALVVAAARALLHVNGAHPKPLALAQQLAEAERYVGTEGGGMDQAICLGAVAGTASRVEFAPLRLTPHAVPPDWRLVVAHSLARAEKSGAAQQRYNHRTQECAAALAAVTAHLGLAGMSYRELVAARPPAELLEAGARALDDPVRRRYRHVITEVDRVTRGETAMARADLDAFGAVLSAAHASLREDFEVSTAALDELVQIATEAGATGARLTGAGMGGCILAAGRTDTVDRMLDELAARFYAPRKIEGSLDDVLFVADPAGGASVEPV